MPNCPNCGRAVQSGMKFCPNCGQDQSVVVPQDQRIPTEHVPVPPPLDDQGAGDGHDRVLLKKVLVGLGAAVVILAVIADLSDGNFGESSTSQPKEAAKNEPKQTAEKKAPAPAPAAASKSSDDVVVRVWGTPGIDYSGSYGATQGQRTVDGTLGAEPTEYDVDAKTGRFEFDAISAVFQKKSPGAGSLLVQIMSKGEVVASQETSAEFGVASVTWSPQNP